MEFDATAERIAPYWNGAQGDPYGPAGAANYDLDAQRIGRRYALAHTTQNELLCEFIAELAIDPILIEFGCGTANDAADVLIKCPTLRYMGIDQSAWMLKQAASKLRNQNLLKRCALVHESFLGLDTKTLSQIARKQVGRDSADCFLSALSLHHYSAAEKIEIYRVAHSLLRNDGIAMFTDLFASAIPTCDTYGLAIELSDIERANSMNMDGTADTTLSVRHYVHENKPLPLTEELGMLRFVGFDRLDVVFRSGQLAIIVAQK